MRDFAFLSRCFFLVLLPVLSGVISRHAQAAPPWLREGKAATALVRMPGGSGSAFCIDASGIFVTNAHVAKLAVDGRLTLVVNAGEPGQQVVQAQILRQNTARDLAVLQVVPQTAPDGAKPPTFTPLPLGDQSKLEETAAVTAFGFPFGTDLAPKPDVYPSVTVSVGRVTALRKTENRLREIQTDASINPGNSGGPLVNDAGQVVGVVYAGVETATGVNFAIPVDEVRAILRTPTLVFAPPPVVYAERKQEKSYSLRLSFAGNYALSREMAAQPANAIQVTLILGRGENQRTYTAVPTGGATANDATYLVKAVPSPTNQPAPYIKLPYVVRIVYNGQVLSEVSGYIAVTGLPDTAPPPGPDWLQPSPPTNGIPPTAAAPPAVSAPPTTTRADAWGFALPAEGTQPAFDGEGDPLAATKRPPNKFGPPPTPIPVVLPGETLLSEPHPEGNATVRVLKVDAKQLVIPPLWSGDGRHVYVLEKGGRLRRASVPDFRLETLRELGAKANSIALSARGLVVGLPELQEVWLLDPVTLATRREAAVGSVSNVVASPSLAFALVVHDPNSTMSALDLSTGKIRRRFIAGQMEESQPTKVKAAEFVPGLSSFEKPIITPDGRYFFCISASTARRFRFVGDGLLYEESSKRELVWYEASVSADSRYIGAVSDNDNCGEIYRVEDLVHPVARFLTESSAKVLGFDFAARRIYEQTGNAQLHVFTPNSTLEQSYFLARQRSPDQWNYYLLPHPDGRKLLALADGQLLWIELPPAPPR